MKSQSLFAFINYFNYTSFVLAADKKFFALFSVASNNLFHLQAHDEWSRWGGGGGNGGEEREWKTFKIRLFKQTEINTLQNISRLLERS